MMTTDILTECERGCYRVETTGYARPSDLVDACYLALNPFGNALFFGGYHFELKSRLSLFSLDPPTNDESIHIEDFNNSCIFSVTCHPGTGDVYLVLSALANGIYSFVKFNQTKKKIVTLTCATNFIKAFTAMTIDRQGIIWISDENGIHRLQEKFADNTLAYLDAYPISNLCGIVCDPFLENVLYAVQKMIPDCDVKYLKKNNSSLFKVLKITFTADSKIPQVVSMCEFQSRQENYIGIAIDWRRVIYLSSFQNHRIIKIESKTAVIIANFEGSMGSTDGYGCKALFRFPKGLAVDPFTGVIYVADTYNAVIRKLTPPDYILEQKEESARRDLENEMLRLLNEDNPYWDMELEVQTKTFHLHQDLLRVRSPNLIRTILLSSKKQDDANDPSIVKDESFVTNGKSVRKLKLNPILSVCAFQALFEFVYSDNMPSLESLSFEEILSILGLAEENFKLIDEHVTLYERLRTILMNALLKLLQQNPKKATEYFGFASKALVLEENLHVLNGWCTNIPRSSNAELGYQNPQAKHQHLEAREQSPMIPFPVSSILLSSKGTLSKDLLALLKENPKNSSDYFVSTIIRNPSEITDLISDSGLFQWRAQPVRKVLHLNRFVLAARSKFFHENGCFPMVDLMDETEWKALNEMMIFIYSGCTESITSPESALWILANCERFQLRSILPLEQHCERMIFRPFNETNCIPFLRIAERLFEGPLRPNLKFLPALADRALAFAVRNFNSLRFSMASLFCNNELRLPIANTNNTAGTTTTTTTTATIGNAGFNIDTSVSVPTITNSDKIDDWFHIEKEASQDFDRIQRCDRILAMKILFTKVFRILE